MTREEQGVGGADSRASVAVVVSAYNRAGLLPGLVEGLRRQTHAFEACIVDNGSTDDTWNELGRLVGGDPRFRRLRVDVNRGPAAARNQGWRSTQAQWVAFTDDDCVPEANWLSSLLDVAESSSAGIVQGATVPADGWEERGWWDRSQNLRRWTGRFETCNLLVSRDLLLGLDGFNETFRIAMGEDVDLGLRAAEMGTRTAFAPDAVVRHHIWRRNFRAFLRERMRWAEIVALIRENSDARIIFDRGFMWGERHAVAWLAVFGLVAASLTGQWWLPGVPVGVLYVHRVLRPRKPGARLSERLRYSALEVVGTFWETACFAVAAVRYRVFVI